MAAPQQKIKPSRSDDNVIPLTRSTDQLLPRGDPQFFVPRGTRATQAGECAACLPSRFEKMLPLLAVGASGVLFAIQALIMKQASLRGAGTFEVVSVRGAIQAVGASSLLRWKQMPMRHWLGVTGPQRRMILVRALSGFLATTLCFASYHHLSLGDATSLQFISPVFSVIFAWLLAGEGATPLELASIAGTIVGVALVARPAFLFGAGEQLSTTGVALAVGGAFATGVTVVLIRELAKQLHWAVVLLAQGLGQAVLAPLAVPLLHRTWVWPDALLGGLFALMGVTSLMAQFLFTYGLARERVGPANAMLALQLVAAFIFQHWLTPTEPVEPLSLVGAALIAGSVLVVVVRRSRAPASKHAAEIEVEMQPASGAPSAELAVAEDDDNASDEEGFDLPLPSIERAASSSSLENGAASSKCVASRAPAATSGA